MRGFRIGRIVGIDLRVDWSWVFIFVLLSWSLIVEFSRLHPNWSTGLAFTTAASASLLFFGCVVLHELAHSVVARRLGVPVRSITLFLLGGVSNIEHEPRSANAELLMALAGPLMSIALGVVFSVLAAITAMPASATPEAYTATAAALGPLATLLAWLGPINIVIGLFNLIPAFPLDGGRVLRSILWKISGSLRSSTRWASSIGQAVGWIFIGAGIAMALGAQVPVFGTGLAGGLWLAFIGWFLRDAAVQASTRLALDDTLAGVTVDQLMRRDVPIASPDLSVATLVHRYLLPGHDRALPVVQGTSLVGLVCIAHIRNVPPEDWAATRVGSIMQHADNLCVATPDEPLAKAFEQLAARNIEQLPVVASGVYVGMLRRHDVTRWLELAWRPSSSISGPPPGPSEERPPARPRAHPTDGDGQRPRPSDGAHDAF